MSGTASPAETSNVFDQFQEAIAGLTEIVTSADESRSRNSSEVGEDWSMTSTALAWGWIEQLHGVARHLPVATVVEFTKDVDHLGFQIRMVIEGPQFPETWFKSGRPIASKIISQPRFPRSAAQFPELWINKARQSLDQLNRIGSLLLIGSPFMNSPEPATIWFHGERGYSVDGITPIVVTEEEHKILEAFLTKDTAMDTHDLENAAAVSNVSRIVRDLAAKNSSLFAPAIRSPGKAKGTGYYIRVRERVKPA
jgi:hypothetical protein